MVWPAPLATLRQRAGHDGGGGGGVGPPDNVSTKHERPKQHMEKVPAVLWRDRSGYRSARRALEEPSDPGVAVQILSSP